MLKIQRHYLGNYRCHRTGNHGVHTSFDEHVSRRFNNSIAVLAAVVHSIATLYRYGGQCVAIVEGKAPNIGHGSWNDNRCQAVAFLKGT